MTETAAPIFPDLAPAARIQLYFCSNEKRNHLVWYRELPNELLTEVLNEVKLRFLWNADTITVRNLKS